MSCRKTLVLLLGAALTLPVATLILVATGRLLAAMQDNGGAAVIDRLALAAGLAWIFVLVLLVIVQALDRLGPPADPPDPSGE